MKSYTVAGPEGLKEMTVGQIAERWKAGTLNASHNFRKGQGWASLAALSAEIEAAMPLVGMPKPPPLPSKINTPLVFVALAAIGIPAMMVINYVQAPAKKAKREAEERIEAERMESIIANGLIKMGMTPTQVEQSWGRPKKVNLTQTPGRKSEQWVYANEYVYFENGIVTSWQTSR